MAEVKTLEDSGGERSGHDYLTKQQIRHLARREGMPIKAARQALRRLSPPDVHQLRLAVERDMTHMGPMTPRGRSLFHSLRA